MNHARLLCLSSVLCLAACSVVPDKVLIAPGFRESEAPAASTASASPMTDSPAAVPMRGDGIGQSYTIGKIGVFMPSGDLDALDDGYWIEGTFGRKLLPFLAVEGQIGYVTADGNIGPTDFEIWAVPLFVNARASLPILFFEPYAGLGVGGIYADYEAGSVFSESDFVLAYQAFIGIEFGLGRLAIGAEYKYVQSEDTKDDFAIEGSVASIFASLPF